MWREPGIPGTRTCVLKRCIFCVLLLSALNSFFFVFFFLQEDEASLVDPLPGRRLPPLEALPRMDVLNRFGKKRSSV